VKNLLNKQSKTGKTFNPIDLWIAHLSHRRFQLLAISSIIFVSFCIRHITHVLAKINDYSGPVLYDPIHEVLPTPVDLSTFIFFLTYSAVFVVFIDAFLKSPIQIVRFGFAIGIMKLLRSFTMVTFPLAPPKDIVPLVDPIVNAMTPNNIVALQDLFFSGHTATMVILFFIAVGPRVKNMMRVLIVVVPLLILYMRVHYTIDVIAGAAVGVGVYMFVKRFVKMPKEFEENLAT